MGLTFNGTEVTDLSFEGGNATQATYVDGSGVATVVWPTTVDPGPRNTYSDWDDSGAVFNQQTSAVEGVPTAWNPGGGSNQRYATETRSIPTITTVTGTQRQVRTCTATGGCDLALVRDISVTVSVTQSSRLETRQCNEAGTVCSTLNPNYQDPFEDTIDGITPVADGIRCSVDATTGAVTVEQTDIYFDSEGFPVAWMLTPTPTRFDVIPFGENPEPRSISVLVEGETPDGFQGGSQNFATTTICTTTQQVGPQPPPILNVTVSYTDAFGSQTRGVEDGDTLNLTDRRNGSTYRVSATGDPGAVITYTAEGNLATANTSFGVNMVRTHSVTSSFGARTTTVSFTVNSNSGGGPSGPGGGDIQ